MDGIGNSAKCGLTVTIPKEGAGLIRPVKFRDHLNLSLAKNAITRLWDTIMRHPVSVWDRSEDTLYAASRIRAVNFSELKMLPTNCLDLL